MKKKKNRPIAGYQVRTADLESISFEDCSLAKCKEYCRKGYVVVSTYRKKFAFRFCITIGSKYEWWRYSKFGHTLTIAWFCFHWEFLWTNKPIEIVYRNPED